VSPQAPVRDWGGTKIRSLDPPIAPASTSQAPDSSQSAPSSAPAPAPAPRRRDQVLSDERTLSRWAHADIVAPIYSRPALNARRISRLRWYTEDGFPEVYLLLRSHFDARGRQWIKLRIPMRPNGRVGWVRRSALGDFHVTRDQLVLKRRRLRIYFYRQGRLRWSAPVGIGAPGTPTPAGRFWIRERFRVFDNGGYGPYAFGTANYSTLSDWPGGGVVGIHGPYHQPGRIPGRPSHGCIRLRIADDAWLGRHLRVGTPLHII
jgi:hypothetical protein